MINIPTLHTARLTLRPWRMSDAEAVFEYASDPDTTRYMIFDTHRTIEDAKDFLAMAPTTEENGYAVTLKVEDRAIGGCGIRPSFQHGKGEIGYILGKAHWGKGYATEFARELIRYGFEDLHLGRIFARTDERNVASMRVLEKAGMTCEGLMRADMVIRGEPRNHLLFSILRADWELSKAAVAARTINTPIGDLFAVTARTGLVRLDFEAVEPDHGASPHLDSIEAELAEYFAGDLREFRTPVYFGGTDFQRSVWRELQTIPYGTTITYTELANRLGNPGAVRAVAAANGSNLLSVIVPCHRVIASNGDLQGYRGGVAKKQFLLDLERGQSQLF